MAKPRITAVVPTRDRPASLERCLGALERQSASELEVLVVDDGSRDASRIEAAVARFPRARLVRTPPRGPAAARNRGIAAAGGEVVLFTDDDCAPEPGWAEALARVLSDGAVAVAGVTETARPANSLAVASQQIADSLTGASSRVDGTAGFAPSSNLGVRSELVSALGFDESYGGAGGEDRDWCARLLHSGHAIRVVPAAVVHHHQELSLLAFWRKHAGYGRGARIFRRRHPRSSAGAARFQLDLLRDAFRHGLAVGAVVLLAQIATAGGYLAERVGERRRCGLSLPPAGRARESRPL